MLLSFSASAIQHMSKVEFALLGGGLTIAVGAAFYFIWRNWHRARVIEDTPTARLRSAPQGYVEVEGWGVMPETSSLVSPLTGTPCLWYRFKVERRNRYRSNDSWTTEDSGSSELPFLLDDHTGQCLVDPRGASVIPNVRQVWYGNDRHQAAQAGFMSRVGAGRYRFTEERLMAGPVYALGWFESLRSADASVSEQLSALLREWKADQAGLLQRFDADRDGSIDPNEWQQARDAAQQQVIQQRAAQSAEPAVNVLQRPQHSAQPFIISSKPQTGLAQRYRWFSAAAVGGFVLAFVALIWLLTSRF